MKHRFTLPIIFLTMAHIAKAQNVGIGTSSPSAKLEVQDNAKTVVKISAASINDSSQLMLSNRSVGKGTDFLFTAAAENGVYVSTKSDYAPYNNDSLFTLMRNGNIGIGTKIPTTPLHIFRNASHLLKLEGNHPYLSLYDTQDGYRGYLWYPGTSIQLGSAATSALPITIAPALATSATFLPNGNVGIGITGPVHKLDVAGTVSADDYLLNNSKTYYYSLGYWDFVASSVFGTANHFESSSTIGWGVFLTSGSQGGVRAPIHLPQGATITRFKVYYYDASVGVKLKVSLCVDTWDATSASIETTDGGSFSETTSITNNPVDNSQHFYFITAEAIGGAWPASTTMVRHVIIEYKLASL